MVKPYTMQKHLQNLTFIVSIIILISSCKASKETIAQRKAEIIQAKESTGTCFVQLIDGSIKNYTSLKLVTGVLKTPYLLADGKIHINGKDINAYQNEDHYAISQNNFSSGHKNYVATETLPGFAIRIAKGSINVYAKKYYNGVGSVDEYFIQKGDEGKIIAYTTENMNMLVKDDEQAMAFFANKSFTTSRSKKDPTQNSLSNSNRSGARNK